MVSLFKLSNSVVVRGLVQVDGKMNELVGINNRPDMYGGKKRLFHHFIRHKLWKFIGCILSEFTYGIKLHAL